MVTRPTTTTTTQAQLEEYESHILGARWPQATDRFCDLLKRGVDLRDLVADTIAISAPYLQVPAHLMVVNGELMLVNYDHTVLAMRASLQLTPHLSPELAALPMAQAIWYIPQGLDIWGQLRGEFPGHYARTKGFTDIKAERPPRCYFEDREAIRRGEDYKQRLDDWVTYTVTGETDLAYRTFLGLVEDDVDRHALKNTIYFASLIERDDTLINRRNRNLGHKALRARAMLDIAEFVGWEQAHPIFYAVAPDLATSPRFYSPYELASVTLEKTFGKDMYTLKERNREALVPEEVDRLAETIMHGSVEDVRSLITGFLEVGKSVQSIGDANMIAAARMIQSLRHPRVYLDCGHAYDYTNIANYWLRNYDHPHQPKVLYLAAWFTRDVAESQRVYAYPALEPDFVPVALDTRSPTDLLVQLEDAILNLRAREAAAVTREYLSRPLDRQPLISLLVICGSKFQNDPHVQRFTISTVEEYAKNRTGREDELLIALAKYLGGCEKRSMALECWDLYQSYFGPFSDRPWEQTRLPA